MHLTRLRMVPLLAVLALAGCGGSGTFAQRAQVEVSNLRAVIIAYDQTPVHDVPSAAAACRAALAGTKVDSVLLSPPATGSDAALGRALAAAYRDARAGFSDCSRSSPYDYPLMARAQTEIEAANAWLEKARLLAH